MVPYELLSFHIEPRDFLDGTRMLQRTCEKPLADALTFPASSQYRADGRYPHCDPLGLTDRGSADFREGRLAEGRKCRSLNS